jgi:glutathione peroxidase
MLKDRFRTFLERGVESLITQTLVAGGAALLALGVALPLALPARAAAGGPMPNDSFYSLKTSTLEGKPADLAQYAGKVTLVVNVASKCGFTPQYKGLEALYKDYSDKGFFVLGFPSNDFGGQEPGNPQEIRTFCERNYGVTFPMFAKLVTKAGPDQSPIYQFLGKSGQLPSWNFCKYLIGKDGKIIAFFPSKVTPEDKELRAAIDAALAQPTRTASAALASASASARR